MIPRSWSALIVTNMSDIFFGNSSTDLKSFLLPRSEYCVYTVEPQGDYENLKRKFLSPKAFGTYQYKWWYT